jgi:hypothetical protein
MHTSKTSSYCRYKSFISPFILASKNGKKEKGRRGYTVGHCDL